MKLDKIKFAIVINWLSRNGLHELAPGDIEDLDNLIDFEVEQPKNVVPAGMVDELLLHMGGGTQKIEAIKAYRALTGAGLKESKDAVERYWVSKPETKQAGKFDESALSDILGPYNEKDRSNKD
jgi:hypothetical protein